MISFALRKLASFIRGFLDWLEADKKRAFWIITVIMGIPWFIAGFIVGALS